MPKIQTFVVIRHLVYGFEIVEGFETKEKAFKYLTDTRFTDCNVYELRKIRFDPLTKPTS